MDDISGEQNEPDASSDEEKDMGSQCRIIDPHQYLAFCMRNKKVKVMDQKNPLIPHVSLKDISLHKKGPLEDKAYSKSSVFYENIRRGNTLCQMFDQNHKPKRLFFCRRGMKKFYDLEPQYFKQNELLTNQQLRYRRMIFSQVDITDSPVHLYSVLKENGEHCQISYLYQLQCWIFASKNVAILARNEEDLQKYYHKERFYWAKLIGLEFLREIESFDVEKKASLIRQLRGKTLLGQHCGYEKHQHITKYKKIQIIYYALVENEGFDHCLPVEKCMQFLNRYNFHTPTMVTVKNLNGKNQIYTEMYKLLKANALGEMDKFGQGSVLYIVAEGKEGQRTIGMCKLKTAQYLVFRKMREMLKINATRKGMTANTFQKYKFQIQNLVKTYFPPPKPLTFYYQLAELAFKEVKEQPHIDETYLRYHFSQFLMKIQSKKKEELEANHSTKAKAILVCLPQVSSAIQKYCKKRKLHVDFTFRYKTGQIENSSVHILYMIPRLPEQLPPTHQIIIFRYSKQEVQQIVRDMEECKDLSNSQLISFVKSTDKRKTIELLHLKLLSFEATCSQKNIPYRPCEGPNKDQIIIDFINLIFFPQNKVNPQQDAFLQSKCNSRVLVLPMAIPGSGKSTLSSKLEILTAHKKHAGVCFRVLHSDELRKKLIEQKRIKIGSCSVSQKKLFEDTKQQSLQEFTQMLEKVLSQGCKEKQILYIDRIYCPTSILQNLKLISNYSVGRIVLLTPLQQLTIINGYSYPFPMSYLLVCLRRCLEREVHQTLNVQPYQVAKVVIKFYQTFRNYNQKILQKQLTTNNIHNVVFMTYPFVINTEPTNLHLKKLVEDCLGMVTPGYECKDSEAFISLVQNLYKYASHFQQPKQSEIEQQQQNPCLRFQEAEKLLGKILMQFD